MVASRNSVWDKKTMIVLFAVMRVHPTHHSFDSCVEDVLTIDFLNEQLKRLVLSKMLSRLNNLARWGRRLKLPYCTLDIFVDTLPLQRGFNAILNFLPCSSSQKPSGTQPPCANRTLHRRWWLAPHEFRNFCHDDRAMPFVFMKTFL